MASTYIPYGLDTDTFAPMDRNASRKELGIPENLYLFGMVAANKDNPPRKSFQEVIDAFAIFHKIHPESGMYFHVFLEQPGGFNIMQYWKFKGLPMDKIFYTPTYTQMFKVDRSTMAKIESTFNCLLNPSTNGGLEATLIEGQAMGMPVIGTDWTAMSELIIPGKTGELVKRLPGPNGLRYSPLGSYVAIPDTMDLYNCMEKVFRYDMKKLSSVCRANAVDNYDAKMVVEKYWKPYFEMLEKEVYPPEIDGEQKAT
jgi:glycosyltransferase involved in cell wall biosynthesis